MKVDAKGAFSSGTFSSVKIDGSVAIKTTVVEARGEKTMQM